jgi:beta-glucosidase
VVLQANQPVALPWESKVKALLDTYYGGDQAGVAAAQVLTGEVNPSGKLPFTWPKSLDQEVAHSATHPERTTAGVNGTTTYSEGVDIGYRYYDATGETPRYPFGYGLSYTGFRYSSLHTADAKDGGLDVTFKVTNTGGSSGTEVAQVYLGAPDRQPEGVRFAPKALAAYGRVTIEAHQSRTVTLHVPLRQLQYWSDTTGWTTATGSRQVVVGGNERDTAAWRKVQISPAVHGRH